MIHIDSCPICSGKDFTPFLTTTDHSVSHETFQIVRCKECNLLITNPRPADSELEKYYLSHTYTSHIKQGKSLMDRVYLLARRFTLKWKFSLLKKYTSVTNGHLLDFGCGVGEFLKISAHHGWAITGVEPSEVARMNADPDVLPYIHGSLRAINSQQKKFDAITAWHVLEHVSDLNNTLASLKHLLAPNGTMFIAVPNHNSLDAAHYAKYWAAYDVPRHLWHFDIDSMTKLMSAHSLTVSAVLPMRLDAFYVSLLSEKYKAGSFDISGSATSLLNGLRSNRFAKTNKEYSSLVYIARR